MALLKQPPSYEYIQFVHNNKNKNPIKMQCLSADSVVVLTMYSWLKIIITIIAGFKFNWVWRLRTNQLHQDCCRLFIFNSTHTYTPSLRSYSNCYCFDLRIRHFPVHIIYLLLFFFKCLVFSINYYVCYIVFNCVVYKLKFIQSK